MILAHWKLFGVFALVVIIGIQQIWLQRYEKKIALFEQERAQQLADQAKRALHNQRNQERTNAEYTAAKRRAATTVVRAQLGTGITIKTGAALSREAAAECVKRGDIHGVLTDFATQHAKDLGDVIARVSQQFAAEASRAAAESEELAAAYRACQAFVVNQE